MSSRLTVNLSHRVGMTHSIGTCRHVHSIIKKNSVRRQSDEKTHSSGNMRYEDDEESCSVAEDVLFSLFILVICQMSDSSDLLRFKSPVDKKYLSDSTEFVGASSQQLWKQNYSAVHFKSLAVLQHKLSVESFFWKRSVLHQTISWCCRFLLLLIVFRLLFPVNNP